MKIKPVLESIKNFLVEFYKERSFNFWLKHGRSNTAALVNIVQNDQQNVCAILINGIPSKEQMKKLFDKSYEYYPGSRTQELLEEEIPDIYDSYCYGEKNDFPLPLSIDLVAEGIIYLRNSPVLCYIGGSEDLEDKIKKYLRNKAKIINKKLE